MYVRKNILCFGEEGVVPFFRVQGRIFVWGLERGGAPSFEPATTWFLLHRLQKLFGVWKGGLPPSSEARRSILAELRAQ